MSNHKITTYATVNGIELDDQYASFNGIVFFTVLTMYSGIFMRHAGTVALKVAAILINNHSF